MIKTTKYARKTFYVDAIRVTEVNLLELAEWCNGKLMKDEEGKTYISVEVYRPMSDRQTQAYVNDWILKTSSGFKCFTSKAFDKAFEKVRGTLTKEQADAAGIRPPIEPKQGEQAPKPADKTKPSPAQMGKQKAHPAKKQQRRNNKKKRPPRLGNVGQAFNEAKAKLMLPTNPPKEGPDPAQVRLEDAALAKGTIAAEGLSVDTVRTTQIDEHTVSATEIRESQIEADIKDVEDSKED